jgi:hypothetical protein
MFLLNNKHCLYLKYFLAKLPVAAAPPLLEAEGASTVCHKENMSKLPPANVILMSEKLLLKLYFNFTIALLYVDIILYHNSYHVNVIFIMQIIFHYDKVCFRLFCNFK